MYTSFKPQTDLSLDHGGQPAYIYDIYSLLAYNYEYTVTTPTD